MTDLSTEDTMADQLIPEFSFPPGFLWGAATSAHQTEGDNTNSNWWHVEHDPRFPLERSGKAVDSYHRYAEDMRLLAEAGLNAYRFGIEWARIEPAPGEFSTAELAHYRAMIETAVGLGLTPVVTLHHFTSPLWFFRAGGWRNPAAADHFARYVDTASAILGDVPWICTINEPNVLALAADLFTGPADGGSDSRLDARAITALLPWGPADDVAEALTLAHLRAAEILHGSTDARVGWTVANHAFEATAGNEDVLERVKWAWEDRFLEVSGVDDFVGVQAYTTRAVGPDGPLPYEPDPTHTLTGWPNRPDALGTAVRNSWKVTGGTPILVTENGIATADDTERVRYLVEALRGLNDAVADGIDVRGYLHWSLLDNYEWGDWGPTFGLVAVDRDTFVRTPRPSLGLLGQLARRHHSGHLAPPTTAFEKEQR